MINEWDELVQAHPTPITWQRIAARVLSERVRVPLLHRFIVALMRRWPGVLMEGEHGVDVAFIDPEPALMYYLMEDSDINLRLMRMYWENAFARLEEEDTRSAQRG